MFLFELARLLSEQVVYLDFLFPFGIMQSTVHTLKHKLNLLRILDARSFFDKLHGSNPVHST